MEIHHILPRCMGGVDDKTNLVKLTPEEHYLAHLLLVKIYPDSRELIYAAKMMTVSSLSQRRSNKLYGWLKRRYVEICRNRVGKNNPSFGKRWYHNTELSCEGKFLQQPSGWISGRLLKVKKRRCRACDAEFIPKRYEKYCSLQCKPSRSETVKQIYKDRDIQVEVNRRQKISQTLRKKSLQLNWKKQQSSKLLDGGSNPSKDAIPRKYVKDKFVEYFSDVAERTAKLSYAERKKVGAIVVKDGSVISLGYNGTPEGWDNVCEKDGVTIPEVIHAEENAIGKLAASTESSEGAVMFTTLSPCLVCAKMIKVAKIKKVFYCEEYRDTYPLEFLRKCGVEVERIQPPASD